MTRPPGLLLIVLYVTVPLVLSAPDLNSAGWIDSSSTIWTTTVWTSNTSSCGFYHESPCNRSTTNSGFDVYQDPDICYLMCKHQARKYMMMMHQGSCLCTDLIADSIWVEQDSVCPVLSPVGHFDGNPQKCGVDEDQQQILRNVTRITVPSVNHVSVVANWTEDILYVTLDAPNGTQSVAIYHEKTNVFVTAQNVPLQNGVTAIPVMNKADIEVVVLTTNNDYSIDALISNGFMVTDPVTLNLDLCSHTVDCVFTTIAVQYQRDPEPITEPLVECDFNYPIVNEEFQCEIRAYGTNLTTTLDLDDGSAIRTIPLEDSQHGVIGVVEDKYATLTVSAQTTAKMQYHNHAQLVDTYGRTTAWEYAADKSGVVSFLIFRPVCDFGNFYCHKLGKCSPLHYCENVNSMVVNCATGRAFSMSSRTCVTPSNGNMYKVGSNGVLRKALTYELVHQYDHNHTHPTGVGFSPYKHVLDSADRFAVQPGDMIGLKDNVKVVPLAPATGAEWTHYQTTGLGILATFGVGTSLSNSPKLPLFAVHYEKASRTKVKYKYTAECIEHAVTAVLTEYDGITKHEATNTVTSYQIINGVAIIDVPNAVKTNESIPFTVTLASGACSANFTWDWDDGSSSFPGNNMITNHVYGERGTYTVGLTAESIYNIPEIRAYRNGTNYSMMQATAAPVTVIVQDEILDLQFVNLPNAIEYGDPLVVSVINTKGSDIHAITVKVLEINWTQSYSYIPNTGSQYIPSAGLTETLSGLMTGVYTIQVIMENLVGQMQIEDRVAVEVDITGLALHDEPYINRNPVYVNISMLTGTRVNFTCQLNGTDCLNWTMSLEDLKGQIFLSPTEYVKPGVFDLTISAVNLLVSEPIVVSKLIEIQFGIYNETVTVDSSNLIRPGDNVTYNVFVGLASNIEMNLQCSDGHSETQRAFHAENLQTYFTHAFTDDGIYSCVLDIFNDIDKAQNTFDFTVQYAVDESLTLINLDQIILTPPSFRKSAEFDLYMKREAHFPTNASFTIDFGVGEIINSTEYLNANELQNNVWRSINIDIYDRIWRMQKVFEEPGDYTFSFKIWNLVSNLTLAKDHMVYDELYEMKYEILAADESPGFPDKHYASPGDAGVLWNYYDRNAPVIFRSNFTRASHESYTWTFGNGETITGDRATSAEIIYGNYSNYPYGEFPTTLTVTNPVSTVSLSIRIHTENPISAISLTTDAATSPYNVSVWWTLNFGSIGTDACYVVEFSDPTILDYQVLLFGDVSLCKAYVVPGVSSVKLYEEPMTTPYMEAQAANGPFTKHIETYWYELGSHTATLTGVNHISNSISSTRFGVTLSLCYFPLIDMIKNACNDPQQCDNGIKVVWKSVDYIVDPTLNIECDGRSPNYTWTIEQAVDRDGPFTPFEDTEGLDLYVRALQIPARYLDYGYYRFTVNVSMFGEEGISSENSTVLKIDKSPLVVKFLDGEVMRKKYNTGFHINLLDMTYDPDFGDASQDKSEFEFLWECRRTCETFPEFDDDDNLVREAQTTCDDYNTLFGLDYGCFWHDGLNSSGAFTNDTGGVQYINSTFSYENATLAIRVHVMRDTRKQTVELALTLTTGDPPVLAVGCNINCHGKTNKAEKFSALAMVKERNPYATYSYSWTIVNATAGKTLLDGDFINDTIWHPWISGTGADSPAISFKANSILSEYYLTEFYLRIESWRGSDRANYGEQIIRITLNDPPIPVGNCSVVPANGTAFDTSFNVRCTDEAFMDGDAPLVYNIYKQLSPTTEATLISVDQNGISHATGFQLPSGKQDQDFMVTIRVECVDKYSSGSYIDARVRVNPPILSSDRLLDQVFESVTPEKMDTLFDSGNTQEAAATLSNMAELLNSVGHSADYEDSATIIATTLAPGVTTEAPSEEELEARRLAEEERERQAKERERQAKEKRMEMRAQLVKNAKRLPVKSASDAKLASGVLSSSMEVPDEVTSEALADGTEIADNVLNSIQAGEMSYEDSKASIQAVTEALGKLIDCSGSLLQKTSNNTTAGRRKRRAAGTASRMHENILDGIAAEISRNTVPAEIPERVTSKKLNITAQNERIADFTGKVSVDGGGEMTMPSVSDILAENNDTEASVNINFSQMENSLYGSEENVANSSTSKTARFLLRNSTGHIMTPAKKVADKPNNLFLVNSGGLKATALPSSAKRGELGPTLKAELQPGASFSIKLEGYIPVTNITDNSTEFGNSTDLGNSTDWSFTTSALPNTATTQAPIINATELRPVGYKVYFKIGSVPTRDSYSWLCILPLKNMSNSVFSTEPVETDGTIGLPDGITYEQLDNYTCFISDKVLNLQEPTTVFYTVEVFDLPEDDTNSTSRKKRSTHGEDEETQTQEYFYTTSITSAQCRYWNEYIGAWVTDGCEVGPLSTSSSTHCLCSVLVPPEDPYAATESPLMQTTTLSPLPPYNPFGGINFGSSFNIPINTFDPSNSAFNRLAEDPLVFSVMVSVMCLYLCTLIWARKWDLRDAMKAGASPLLDNDPQDSYLYEITVFTGTKRGAGTTAKVSMIFSGLEEETQPRLIYDDKRKTLESGGVDSFLMAVPRPLGPLNHIRVWHDNSGNSPSWHMAYICVVDLITREKFYFVANTWFSLAEGDGCLDRVIPTASRDDLTDFAHLFWSKTRKDLTDSHIWFSVFGRPAKSPFTRVQRVTCCLSLLFTTMAANALFSEPPDEEGGAGIEIGPISLSMTQIVSGVLSSLVAFPINIVVVYIFRSCKHRETQTLKDAKDRVKNYQQTHKSLDDLNKMKSVKSKKKRSCSNFLLPWWFQIVGYFLCLCLVGGSFYATVELTMVFGVARARAWLTSFVVGFFESLLLSQPIKVILFAMFYALVIKSPTIEDELDNDPGLLQGEEYLHTHNTNYNAEYLSLQKRLAKYKNLPSPPRPELITAAKVRKVKERAMQSILKEILIYTVFLSVLYLVSLGSKNIGIAHTLYQHHKNALYEGLHQPLEGPMAVGPNGYFFGSPLPMHKVSTLDDFWLWMRSNYIPYMYGTTNYNGEKMPKFSTQDGVNFIVGSTRLRQLRVKAENCYPAVYRYEQTCGFSYKKVREVNEHFGPAWTRLKDGEEPAEGFIYNTTEDIDGISNVGVMNTMYHGGGYSYSLQRNAEKAMDAVDYLNENQWIDTDTRAIFVEFTLYNNQMNLYTTSFIIFDRLSTGAFHADFDVKLIRLDRYFGGAGIMVLICEFLMLGFVIGYFVVECREMHRKKIEYFYEFWNKVELVMLLLLMIVIAMIGYRWHLMFATSNKRREIERNDYISFQYTAWFEELYSQILGFALYVAVVKFLKLLRFNNKMRLVGATLFRIAAPFMSFMIAMLTVFLAFVHMSYLVYNTLLIEFSSVISTLETLFTIMLNKFDYKRMENASQVFAPIIFMSFTIIVGFGMISFMLTIIMEGFAQVQEEFRDAPNKYELVDFLMGKFKGVLGIGSDERPRATDRKEDFVEDAQTELNLKFNEFSEKIFGIFLQDPDDIKTMKIADNMIRLQHKRKKQKHIYSG